MSEPRRIIVVADDPVLPASLVSLARELDVSIEVVRSVRETDAVAGAPLAIVADIAQDGAIDAPPRWRVRWPGALIAGSIAVPRRDIWEAALAAGYDLVTNRGAVANRLRAGLASWSGPRRAARVRLVDVADVAGRLGVVARIDDTPAGALAVYHLGGTLYAAGDACPHAGGRLSRGELDGAVITCPLHGSQFDVRSGERLRGPSDDPIAVYPVVVEGGVAYAEVGAERGSG